MEFSSVRAVVAGGVVSLGAGMLACAAHNPVSPTSIEIPDGDYHSLMTASIGAGVGSIAITPVHNAVTGTLDMIIKVRVQGVKRSHGDRGSLWSAKVSQEAAASGLLNKVLNHVFDGSAQRLVAHLLDEGKLIEKDCQEIRRLLAAADRAKPSNQGAKSTPVMSRVSCSAHRCFTGACNRVFDAPRGKFASCFSASGNSQWRDFCQ